MKEVLSAYRLKPYALRESLKGYSLARFQADLRAGTNVALLAFPQGMAYALLAGLPLQYGIYCSAIAAIVAPLLSSSRLLINGPTNATAVMLLSVLITLPPNVDRLGCISLLVFMVGLFLVIGATVRLASLIKFISRSVIIGYITGAALLIGINQLRNILGTSIPEASTFFDVCVHTLATLPQTHWPSLVMAALTFGALWAAKRWLPFLPGVALTLVLASLAALAFLAAGHELKMLNPLPMGAWPITPPTLNFTWFSLLAGPAVAIAFLSTLESTIMAKSIASRTGDPVNANQEMLSIGVANIASGFLSGMPASGSLTRTQLNWRSGGTSPLACIVSGVLCAVGALTLGPLVGYIPVSALAAVVIGVAISLIDPHQIRVALKSTKSDAAVLIVTFTAALLTPLDTAIFIGVATSIGLFLHKSSSPQLAEYTFNDEGNLCELREKTAREIPSISIIHVEGDLYFGAADLFRDEIRRVCDDPSLNVVILRMRNARHLDATSVLALEELIKFVHDAGRHLLISGARRDVYRVLRNSGLLHILGRDNLFMGSPSNPNASTRKALKRAQALMGEDKADVRIFYDPSIKKKQENG